MRRRLTSFWAMFALVFLLILGGALGYAQFAPHADAYAGAEIIGNPNGAEYRALIAPQGGKVERIAYFDTNAIVTPAVTSTPVDSAAVCGLGGYTLYKAEVTLSGTMTGTAPTLAVLWQNSIDGGQNWTNIGTWTTINATVTPASQSQVVSDVYNSTTAVAYGDCWRVRLQFGGTGSVGANVEVHGLAK